jgi:hypothetical protein
MEWNKLHALLARLPDGFCLQDGLSKPAQRQQLSDLLTISVDELDRFRVLSPLEGTSLLEKIRSREISFGVRLLNGSLSQYMRASHEWFEAITAEIPDIVDRPVYFVSSNTHSLVNLLNGFTRQHENALLEFIQSDPGSEIHAEWQRIHAGETKSNRANLLYYVLKKYQNSPAGSGSLGLQLRQEEDSGIHRIASRQTFEVEAQVIELNKLDPVRMDDRLAGKDFAFLKDSRAVILNIDYPLGLAAYNLLATISIHLTDVRGVYIMGKAASLNAARGDVIIPNVVQDEHSHNTYLFQNCFTAGDVAPFQNYGTVLDNQKAICVLGTFLQNAHLMDVFYREGFADIEMELGNFLSAIYEATRPKRYPLNEIVSLYNIPLDFGALHYVSDTPMLKGKNLGEGTLSYYGIDSTYACSLAILGRIFTLESRGDL